MAVIKPPTEPLNVEVSGVKKRVSLNDLLVRVRLKSWLKMFPHAADAINHRDESRQTVRGILDGDCKCDDGLQFTKRFLSTDTRKSVL